MKKIEIIDYLRGFSIFTIVLMHLIQSYPIPQIIRTASSFGGAGVHVFILCSGFGLYLSHFKQATIIHKFSKKKIYKSIYSLYSYYITKCMYTLLCFIRKQIYRITKSHFLI